MTDMDKDPMSKTLTLLTEAALMIAGAFVLYGLFVVLP